MVNIIIPTIRNLLRIDSLTTAIRAAIGWPMLATGLFFLTALIGSILPANNSWQQPDGDGVQLFVESNGVHVGLVVPLTAAGEDISDIVKPGHLNDPDDYGTHIMIGWGHAGVYRNAETWADVRAADVWDAATGSDDTLIHIYHRSNPKPAAHRKPLRVTIAQYKFIIREIRRNFRADSYGQIPHYPAYGDDNLFYAATGRYSAFHTCNEWVASLLRRSGVRVGVWTPFAGGVMRWF